MVASSTVASSVTGGELVLVQQNRRTDLVEFNVDGRGRWIDNRFIERLWRSVKYEEVYLRDYDAPPAAMAPASCCNSATGTTTGPNATSACGSSGRG